MTEKYENAFVQMKKEFFGIEPQIEQILKSVEAWEVTKDYIVRPNIFNIVGLTGVGKTAVINRIMELLDLKDKTVYLKFNNKTTDVIDALKVNNIQDSIFVFDEFQYLRTKNEKGEELKESDDKGFNIIWDLLDSGEVILQRNVKPYFGEFRLMNILEDFLMDDVQYNKGVFKHEALERIMLKHRIAFDSFYRLRVFKESIESGLFERAPNEFTMDSYYAQLNSRRNSGETESEIDRIGYKSAQQTTYNDVDEEDMNKHAKNELTLNSFINISFQTLYEAINCVSDKYNFKNEYEIKKTLYDLKSTVEVYEFFKQFENSKPIPINKNFKNSLIITLSNIDEAYEVANQVGSDLDADFFHKHTSNVSIVKIRQALFERFRPEQIARFGSNYILYPSLSRKSFEQIISKELDSFGNMVKTKFSGENDAIKVSDVKFGNKIHEIIYLEGVFPTIGARCVFSTVSEIVSEKLSRIIMTLFELNKKYKDIRIELDYVKRTSIVVITYIDNVTNEVINKDEIKYVVRVNNLRKEKKENIGKQAHRAVHEAGHAVCSVVLMNILPEVIYSTVMESKGAFNMFTDEDFYYDRKNTYLKHIATLMGGYAAESIIFGEENVSNGSSSDLGAATRKLNSLFKDCGFGDKLGRFVSQQMPGGGMEDRNYSIVDNNEFDTAIVVKLLEAKELAIETISAQKNLLLKLSEQLIKTPKMQKKKIKEFIVKYSSNYDLSLLDENPTIFYLNMVNTQLESLNNVKQVALSKN